MRKILIKDASLGFRSQLFEVLESKNVCVYPCDTIYGFIGVVPETQLLMNHLKQREDSQACIQYAYSVEQIEEDSGSKVPHDLLKYWPGPLSIILSHRTKGSVAYRIPADPLLCEYIEAKQCFLYTTSVNRHGEQPLQFLDDIKSILKDDIVCIYDRQCEGRSVASTLIDAREKPYTILRRGEINIASANDTTTSLV